MLLRARWMNCHTHVSQVNYIFFESASGFGLFERTESEDIGKLTEEVQNSVLEMKRFGKIMRLASFLPFTSAENALLCQNEISEGALMN